MSFESNSKFNPEHETEAQHLNSLEPENDVSSYTAAEQLAARIPGDVDSQVYELRRMYRL